MGKNTQPNTQTRTRIIAMAALLLGWFALVVFFMLGANFLQGELLSELSGGGVAGYVLSSLVNVLGYFVPSAIIGCVGVVLFRKIAVKDPVLAGVIVAAFPTLAFSISASLMSTAIIPYSWYASSIVMLFIFALGLIISAVVNVWLYRKAPGIVGRRAVTAIAIILPIAIIALAMAYTVFQIMTLTP